MSNLNQDTYYIIGISPGNSYFKDNEVRYLLETTIDRFGRVVIMIADVPAISTYVAFGYPENRARRDKAIPQGNLLKNRVQKAMVQLGYTTDQVRIIDWAVEVEPNEKYQLHYKDVRNLFDSNIEFKNDALETTKAVLEGSSRSIPDIGKASEVAVHYLLSEFAFLEFAAEFLQSPKVAYIYHKNWSVYENYIAGKYDNKQKDHLDFLLIENPWETYNPIWGLEDEEQNENYKTGLERVQDTKILRVAFSNYPPAVMYDHDYDNFFGIFYEIIVEVARRNNWQVRWGEEVGYGVITDGLENSRFDIFGSTVWPTPERKDKATFSISLYKSLVFPYAKVGFNKTNTEIKEDQLIRIVVKENDISHSIASADYPMARIIYTPQLSSTTELLKFIVEDKGDVTFVEPYLAEYFNKNSDEKVVAISNEPIRTYENTFIFKKDDSSLKELFDKEITDMKDNGFIKNLIQKYTGSENTFTD